MPTVEERISAVEAKVEAIADLKTMIGELRADLHRMAGDLRTDMNQQFAQVRSDISRLDERVDRHFMWMVGIQFSVLIAVIVALIRLSPP